jgi:thiamine-monophosphate kinase
VRAAIDVSDGLLGDLAALLAASAAGADLELGPLARACDAAGIPLPLALGGGEDYELLAALDPSAVERAAGVLSDRYGVTLTRVGTIIEGGELVAVGLEGHEAPLEPKGWDHFS